MRVGYGGLGRPGKVDGAWGGLNDDDCRLWLFLFLRTFELNGVDVSTYPGFAGTPIRTLTWRLLDDADT